MIFTNSPTYWLRMLEVPLAERLQHAPQELVNFVAQYNDAAQSAARPRSVPVSIEMLADLRVAIDELPQAVIDLLEPRLLGIFFISGLGSSAITNLICYANGDLLGAVIAIDAEVFSRARANDWASWRENTAFAGMPGIRLAVHIADSDQDDRSAALQYVLLHEFGHVLATATGLVPDWWKENQSTDGLRKQDFVALSWQLAADGSIRPLAQNEFPLRKDVQLYATPRLSADNIPQVYEDLAKTTFPTLYAATDIQEDFAESFAGYVHTVLLGKQHEVRIHINEEPAAAHENFWTTPRSTAKAAFFASFLARPPEQFPRHRQHAGMAALCTDIIRTASTKFLGLAPFLRASTDSGDLRHVAEELLKQTGDDPDNAILWMNLSTAFFSVSEHALGLAMQRQGLALRRQFSLPAFRQPARCHVLLVMAPGDLAENMPLDCLLELGEVDLTLYYATVAAPLPYEVPVHDVLVVGLSDTEKNRPMLNALESLLDAWDKPVINRPQHIPNVERNAASVLLQGIPGLSMPLTHQISRTRLQEIVRDPSLEMDAGGEACFPIILRPVGSHAGRNLARINDAKEIADYLAAVPDEEFYLSRFIDYSGTDGLFRKYRIALIDGWPFASHMAISAHWMIHYVNAGMYSNGEKRAEEAAFMQNFDRFSGRHRTALDALAQRIGLDYVCIDCAETREGELLIFEVDHAMVVHAMDPEDLFPYKQAHVLKARQAFTDLLLQRMSAALPIFHG